VVRVDKILMDYVLGVVCDGLYGLWVIVRWNKDL
jgi:hypothetical protein